MVIVGDGSYIPVYFHKIIIRIGIQNFQLHV